jgi:uncharacterized RDD family membrane protein YckC
MENNAGFWRRVSAYLVDIIPIVFLTGAIFYFCYGFDDILRSRFTRPNDLQARVEFIHMRNIIRNISLLIWILYCALLEGTAYQATFGKLLVGLKVVDENGNRISWKRSFGRNLFKFINYIALGLGFIWVAFTKNKQGWHDLVAKTYEVKKIEQQN